MAHFPLHGKVALITGGAQGIGLGIAKALASRGTKVALVDLDPELLGDAAASLGDERAIAVTADVTNSDAMETAVAAAVDSFGGVDVVVANAGVAPRPATTRVMDPVEFERVVEVDLLGVYRTVRAAMPQIVQRRGHVVVVSSIYAFVNGMLLAPYAISKAGVEQLGRALRVELAGHGASATVAYFGFVDTKMVSDAVEPDSRIGAVQEELIPSWVRKPITPEHAGEVVARAIERRRPRVMAPRFWLGLSVLRGIASPAMDFVSTRMPQVQGLLREADRQTPAALREGPREQVIADAEESAGAQEVRASPVEEEPHPAHVEEEESTARQEDDAEKSTAVQEPPAPVQEPSDPVQEPSTPLQERSTPVQEGTPTEPE